jgi:hypothetical protein
MGGGGGGGRGGGAGRVEGGGAAARSGVFLFPLSQGFTTIVDRLVICLGKLLVPS